MDLREALAQSCDVYFWVAGRDYLGVDRIASYSQEMGLGYETGIDLPTQTAGFVPTPQWKERRFHEKWLGGDTMNMSIGQGYLLVVITSYSIHYTKLYDLLGDFIEDKDVENPANQTAFTLLQEQLRSVLSTLPPREQEVLKMRFGLDDGYSLTLEEVGLYFNVTRERIRQIEAKALRRLRHPRRSRKLKDYLDN